MAVAVDHHVKQVDLKYTWEADGIRSELRGLLKSFHYSPGKDVWPSPLITIMSLLSCLSPPRCLGCVRGFKLH